MPASLGPGNRFLPGRSGSSSSDIYTTATNTHHTSMYLFLIMNIELHLVKIMI